MRERPIIFSAPMVRAILDGRKTQMRRVIKGYQGSWLGISDPAIEKCPYGVPGDRLWVRHVHWRGGGPANDQVWDEFTRTSRWQDGREIKDHGLVLDENGKHILLKKKPPIFMPRWAARIFLELTSVRIGKLWDISGEDVVAEGCPNCLAANLGITEHFEQFQILWDSINAKRGYPWKDNPWVWVIEFQKVAPPRRGEDR